MADHDDEEEEEEEDDFHPGDDDDDDDDDDGDYDAEENEDDRTFPTFLEGNLYLDPSKGLCYEQPGLFCLASQLQSNTFDFSSPSPLDTPLPFHGWIQDPTEWLEFLVTFSKEAALSGDPLEEKLLQAQEEKNQSMRNVATATTAAAKSGEDVDEVTSKKRSTTTAKLKSPPSYSTTENVKSPPPTDSSDVQASPSGKAVASTDGGEGTLVVMSGSQLINGSGNNDNHRKITFRGAYRPPRTTVDQLWIISSVVVEEPTTTSTAAATGGTAGAAAPAAAAAARKRGRNDDDDDSVDGNGGVDYQELIDLHDDAGLSTEELRQRYYGTDDIPTTTTSGNDGAKQPASAHKKSRQQEEQDDDGDDDDYGF
ncbi:hypothetical protein IV203_032655 [Nitzschia inconspicua]|uniref:Uncharacterized protein n=1 Tax=Nitzschia inconspicua TaxID=303405 RepID=A0A9K3KK02_9STRA|nr:hypothetical protein IV203_032655 [Nitzschia inconspicua]